MSVKQNIKYLFFSIIPCLLLILFFETALRLYYQLRLGGYEYRIQKFVEMKGVGPYYDDRNKWSNDMGFIGEGIFDPLKKKNEYRILVLGGSGVAGTREANWPAILQEQLNNAGFKKRVTVINGGIAGHTSSGEKMYLTRWINLKPDLIIIYDLWNDLYYSHYLPEEYEEDFKISNSYYYPKLPEVIKDKLYWNSVLCRELSKALKIYKQKNKKKTKEKRDSSPLIPNAVNILSEKDRGNYSSEKKFTTIFEWHYGPKEKTINLSQPIKDDLSVIYHTNLNEMINLALKHDVKIILIQQPDCLYYFSNNKEKFNAEDHEAIISFIRHPGLMQDWINTTNALYPKALQIMKSFENKKNIIGIYTINGIFDKYKDKRMFWGETCHHTPAGKKVIGEYIAELIKEKKLIE